MEGTLLVVRQVDGDLTEADARQLLVGEIGEVVGRQQVRRLEQSPHERTEPRCDLNRCRVRARVDSHGGGVLRLRPGRATRVITGTGLARATASTARRS